MSDTEEDSQKVEITRWDTIAPIDARNIDLRERPDIQGPINQMGEECPWPWEPQQLTNMPLGQYHCPYCGEMVVAGIKHVDYAK